MRPRRKTLLILSPGFPKDEEDSTCIPPQQQFVKALKETYPLLTVVVLTFQYPFFTAEYQWFGVRVIAFGGKSRGKLFRLMTWMRVWRSLLKLHREYEVIGLLSFWLGECAFVASYFAKLKKLRHYCWLLGQDAKAGNKYVKWTHPTGNELIALSDFIVREFKKNYAITPANVITVGINPSLFKPIEMERNIDVLGAGSLIPLKQYPVFIEVIDSLRSAFPDMNTFICGDGPERQKLVALINSLALENSVELKGELPHQQVLALMQRSKVFLHTSAYEGFGAVCLEALYGGAHVVSFVKPMDATIPNWHTVGSIEEMSRAVKALLSDPKLNHEAVLPYPIADNAKKMMKLFNYSEEAID
ncbi:glycosyltransferase [Runella sp.]|uniref:glycosyltransferase n=1 Tax=Runella sp. TaxID=1960881 RepID=UPI003D0BD04F